MRQVPDAGVRVLQGHAQMALCLRQGTALLADGVVALASSDPVTPAPQGGADFTGGLAGLAFDSHCRLFHARTADAGLEVVLWGRTDASGVHEAEASPLPITGSDAVQAGALPQQVGALACGGDDFLYVADAAGSAVWLVDTWQHEVARHLPMPAAPLDLARSGDAVYALLADGSIWQLSPCDAPQPTPWPAVPGAGRLALGPPPSTGLGRPLAWVLTAPGTAAATLHPLHRGAPPAEALPAPYGTALLVEPTVSPDGVHVLVLAQRPGEALRRLQVGDATPLALPGLVAPHYDGRGITLAPDGRVAYWTARGLRHAAPARGHYVDSGLLFGIALDSDHDQSTWGRLVVEACVPAGTRIRFWAFSGDEPEVSDPVSPTPAGLPPTLPQHVWDACTAAPQELFRDPTQRPLAPAPAEGFALFDAPVMAPPGRCLWLVFQLEGTRSRSPRLRSAQVDYPGHGLLQMLPRTLWREPAARSFLFRALMPLAAVLDEWDAVASGRQRLLDARITPSGALPWLASFVGLVLDPCWPEPVQRRLVLECATLFRTRGTLGSLQRMLELLTDAQVTIIEQFRLRGGGVVGNPASVVSQAVLGGGYRVGGRIGEPGAEPIADAVAPNFDDFAHRFNVTIVAALTDAQLACARRLVEQHKPAHTDFTLCTAQAGLRAGVGAHVGISSVVGHSGGFAPAITGDAALGAGFILGRPALRPDSPPAEPPGEPA